MIIALFALSSVMIVGGIASVVQGFPYVRLESGLAMVIAGATTASAGAVLLGIATLAARVRRLELALGATRPAPAPDATVADPPRRPVLRSAPPAEAVASVAPADSVPAQRPSIAAAAGFAGLATADAAFAPGPSAPARPASEANVADAGFTPDAPEPLLPDLLPPQVLPPQVLPPAILPPAILHSEAPPPEVLPPEVLPPEEADRPTSAADPVRAVDEPWTPPEAPPVPERDLFAMSGAPASGDGAGEAVAHQAPDEAAGEPVPFTAVDTPAATPAEHGLQVVGTYASGGNTYVMFSNGSIEAETPRGRYTFDSLDELKAFVEAGGESDTRGAA